MRNLKSDSHLPSHLSMESPLKMINNTFYVILKALFVLKLFKFLSWLFGHVGKTAWLERQYEFQNSWRHSLVSKQLQYIFPSISRCRVNQTMKLGQLIEFSKTNIFLQKSSIAWGSETSSRPLFVFWKSFIKIKSKWSATNWPNFIAWLSLFLKIFGNTCIIIVFYQAVTS